MATTKSTHESSCSDLKIAPEYFVAISIHGIPFKTDNRTLECMNESPCISSALLKRIIPNKKREYHKSKMKKCMQKNFPTRLTTLYYSFFAEQSEKLFRSKEKNIERSSEISVAFSER